VVTPGAYPRRKHLKGTPIGLALALPSNTKTWLERVSKEKHSSLFNLFVSDAEQKFYAIDSRCFQTFTWKILWKMLFINHTLTLEPHCVGSGMLWCCSIQEEIWRELPKDTQCVGATANGTASIRHLCRKLNYHRHQIFRRVENMNINYSDHSVYLSAILKVF